MAFAIEYLMHNFFVTLRIIFFFDIDDVRVLALSQVQEHHNCKAHPFPIEVNHSIFFSHLSFQPSSRNKAFIKLMRKSNF